MNTTSKNIAKLQDNSQERDEAKVQLSEYFLANQDSLPQELVNAWVGFERLELEAKTIETEVLKGMEREIVERQKVEGETAKSLDHLKSCIHLMLAFLIAELLAGIVARDLSPQLPEPNFTGCTGSSFPFMC